MIFSIYWCEIRRIVIVHVDDNKKGLYRRFEADKIGLDGVE